jgi:ABC-2 type transport system permease protein
MSLTLLPVLLALFLWWIFSQSIVRNLPIAVVDLQQSTLSRQLIRDFDATSELKIVQKISNLGAAKKALVGNEIYAYVVVPKHFDRDLYLGMTPQVTAFYNSQFILVGKLINKSLLTAHGTFDAQVGIAKELNKGNRNVSSAFGQTVAIRTQVTPLFNQNSSYAQFLLSGIVPALWQISIILSTVLFLTANHRIYGAQKMLRENYFKKVFSISFFYLPFFLIQGVAFLVWFYVMLDWPMFGSFVTLFFAQLVTAVACMIMGGLFFFLTLDPTRAMSFAAVFTAPSFAFMGVTFPVTDMGLLAKIWRNLLPISHYIEAQISQVSYGVTTWETIAQFMPSMTFYLVPLLLLTLLINKHHKQLDLKYETD